MAAVLRFIVLLDGRYGQVGAGTKHLIGFNALTKY